MERRVLDSGPAARDRKRRRPAYRPVLERVEARELLAELLSTFYVQTTADSGPGSLRQAISDANQSPGLDTIDFAIGNEYGLPTPAAGPGQMTAGPGGNLWFVESNAGKIGRISTSGQITEYPIANSLSLQGITEGPDGNIWFTGVQFLYPETNQGYIGRITPAGVITRFVLPGGGFGESPEGITQGPDGALWFTENGEVSGIGRITTGGTFAVPFVVPSTSLAEITTGPDGALWYTDPGSNQIGRVTTAGVFTTYAIPTAGSSPLGITTGPDGNLWFTESAGSANQIGKLSTSGSFTEYAIPTPVSDPTFITTGSDGSLWFTEQSGGLGRITTSGTVTEYPTESPGSAPIGIANGSDGNLWYTESTQEVNAVARLDFAAAGPIVIPTSTPLVVSDPVVIDGYTQPGAQPSTAAVGSNALIPVVVQGNPPASSSMTADPNASGFVIVSGGTTLKGLTIDGFRGSGVVLAEQGGNDIEGNFIGTDSTGSTARGNLVAGVLVGAFRVASSDNVIGGTSPAARNVISGNGGPGVWLASGTTGNRVEGNLIGSNANGTRAVGNGNIGVLVDQSPDNVVGGTNPGAGNVISGNRAATLPGPNPDPATTGAGGVVIIGPAATGNAVIGNLIGTTASGAGRLGNAYDGVGISGAPGNTVGGAGPAGNTISANGGVGVRIAGAGASGNSVLNNRIGTDAGGSLALGNAYDGVFLNLAPGNRIGAPGLGNVIAASGFSGIFILGASATGNLVESNFIGTGIGGVGNLGNTDDGVLIQNATGNTIGQTGAGNTIRNNRLGGIQVFAGVTPLLPGSFGGNVVVGNVGQPGVAATRAAGIHRTPVRAAVADLFGARRTLTAARVRR